MPQLVDTTIIKISSKLKAPASYLFLPHHFIIIIHIYFFDFHSQTQKSIKRREMQDRNL